MGAAVLGSLDEHLAAFKVTSRQRRPMKGTLAHARRERKADEHASFPSGRVAAQAIIFRPVHR